MTVQSPESTVRSDFCHNCGIRLTGKFCAACGQKAVPLSVTVHDFFHELTHEILHVDGRIVQSIRRLLLSPGFLTREYLQGHRARWISPIRLYLIFSVAYFGLSALTGFDVGIHERQPTRSNSNWTFSARSRSPISITIDEGEDSEEEARKLGFENAAALQQAINDRVLAWIPRVMFVLLPLFAWLVALAFRRVDRNYLHHLIFSVHIHAAWFAAAALGKAVELASHPLGDALGRIAIVFAGVYGVLAFRAVYGKVRFAAARIAVVLVVYAAIYLLAFIAVVLPIILPAVLTKSS